MPEGLSAWHRCSPAQACAGLSEQWQHSWPVMQQRFTCSTS
jgi:hypothetical protein